MQSARSLLASSKSSGGAWEGFKAKFKARFMIGDQYEHYIPPRPQFQNRESAFGNDNDQYRVPAPGSQPEAVVPRGYPETEFDISLAKRAAIKLTPSGGLTNPLVAEKEAFPLESATFGKHMPRHIPVSEWKFNRDQLKRIRRFYLETGIILPGVPNFGRFSVYHPVQETQTRDEWEQVEVIRDIRKPRI